MDVRRLNIDVYAHFSQSGQVQPKGFFLYKGQCFVVTKVLSIQKAANRKVGGSGTRYECLVQEPDCMERKRTLWREDDQWFVEEVIEQRGI